MSKNVERNAEIIRRRKAGEGPREIARRLKLSPSVVAGVLGRADCVDHNAPQANRSPRRANRKLTFAQAEIIRKRWCCGETQTALAKEFGITQPAVAAIIYYQVHRAA